MEPYQKVGARYYDATFGRFLTRDTVLSQSPYAYCDGDPVNKTDPTGHITVMDWMLMNHQTTVDQCGGDDTSEAHKQLGEAITKFGDDLAIFGGGVAAFGPKMNGDPQNPWLDLTTDSIVGFGGMLIQIGGAFHIFGEVVSTSKGGIYTGINVGPFNVDPSPNPGGFSKYN